MAGDVVVAEDGDGADGQGGPDEQGGSEISDDIGGSGDTGADGWTDAAAAEDADKDAAEDADDAAAEDALSDGVSGDAGSDAEDDDGAAADGGPVAQPCGVCPWDQQPGGDHPGAKGTHAITPGETIGYGGGIGQGYKDILVIKPVVAGVLPTLFFVAGRQLYQGGGLIGELGHPYRALLDHVASYGFNVAFVRVEQNGLDNDHERMAKDLLEATNVFFDKVSTADPSKAIFAGHGAGAKVAFLAAWKTLSTDMDGQWVDPAAVLCFGLINDKPTFGAWTNAVDKAKQIVAAEPTRFTFVEADDDAVASWNDKSKKNSAAVYAAMPTTLKQIVVLHGTGGGDKNPVASPELHDDYSAPLTVNGKVGGLIDLTIPDSHLDALDWYGYWKFVVGAMQVAFDAGDEKWAYGALRTHGGALPDGTVIEHEIAQQGW